MPMGALAVSPCTISTWSSPMPIMSATTCAKLVSWPCPWLWLPVITTSPPVAFTRTVADS